MPSRRTANLLRAATVHLFRLTALAALAHVLLGLPVIGVRYCLLATAAAFGFWIAALGCVEPTPTAPPTARYTGQDAPRRASLAS